MSGGLLAAVAVAAAELYSGGTQVHETSHERWTRTLREVGLNTVAATVYARQGDWDSDDLFFAEEEPSVTAEIRAAKERGLHVVLTLRVALDHAHPRNGFLWHGMIMPASEEGIRSWFAKYTRFALKWAEVSQREGVDVLALGSELNELNETLPITRRGNLESYYGYTWYERLSRRRARRFADEIEASALWMPGRERYRTLEEYLDVRFRKTVDWARQAHLRPGAHTLRRVNERRELIDGLWVGLIREVRSAYRGRLTYAANFDSYDGVSFWRQLDLIGIIAYFSLRPNLAAPSTLSDFTAAWRDVLARIRSFKAEQGLNGMPLLLTELGYTYRRHATVEPWAHAGFSVVGWKSHARQLVVWSEQPVDHDERALAIEALRRASLEHPGELAGLLYWKLSTDRAHDAIEPFVLYVGADSTDPLMPVLRDFGNRGE